MSIDTLAAVQRTATGSMNTRRLRRDGNVPAVLYGHGEEVLLLALPAATVQDMVEKGHHVVTLDVEGLGAQRALVKEVQFDNWQNHILHVDFARVALDETVSVTVELKTHGQPKAILAGGVLEQPMHQLHVECQADRIPDSITIEIGHLEMNQMLHVKELELPEGVKSLDDPDALVAVIHEPRGGVEEEAEESAEGATAAEPELIGRHAKEDDSEEKES